MGPRIRNSALIRRARTCYSYTVSAWTKWWSLDGGTCNAI